MLYIVLVVVSSVLVSGRPTEDGGPQSLAAAGQRVQNAAGGPQVLTAAAHTVQNVTEGPEVLNATELIILDLKDEFGEEEVIVLTVPATENADTKVAAATDVENAESKVAAAADIENADPKVAAATDVENADTKEAAAVDVKNADNKAAAAMDVEYADTKDAAAADVKNTDTKVAAATDVKNADTKVAAAADVKNADTKVAAATDVENADTKVTSASDVKNADTKVAAATDVKNADTKVAAAGKRDSKRADLLEAEQETAGQLFKHTSRRRRSTDKLEILETRDLDSLARVDRQAGRSGLDESAAAEPTATAALDQPEQVQGEPTRAERRGNSSQKSGGKSTSSGGRYSGRTKRAAEEDPEDLGEEWLENLEKRSAMDVSQDELDYQQTDLTGMYRDRRRRSESENLFGLVPQVSIHAVKVKSRGKHGNTAQVAEAGATSSRVVFDSDVSGRKKRNSVLPFSVNDARVKTLKIEQNDFLALPQRLKLDKSRAERLKSPQSVNQEV